MDMFDDMLIKDIVPTATAAKQNIERVIAFGTIRRDSNPKDIIAYMKQGGRQVPFKHPAGKGKVACHCCTAFCNSLQSVDCILQLACPITAAEGQRCIVCAAVRILICRQISIRTHKRMLVLVFPPDSASTDFLDCRVEYALDALIGRSREENELTGDTPFLLM